MGGVLGFPVVDRRPRDSIEWCQSPDRRLSLELSENLYELLLRVQLAFHVSPSLLLRLQSDWCRKEGQGHGSFSAPMGGYDDRCAAP